MHLAHFWFTLFHEAGHLLNDGKREVFVDVDYAEGPCEPAANAFAYHLLIPPGYQTELPSLKSRIAVEEFARRIGIHPGFPFVSPKRQRGRFGDPFNSGIPKTAVLTLNAGVG